MSLKYLGDINAKSGNFSTFSDKSGASFKMLGGDIGDAVVYDETRDLIFSVSKKLLSDLSTNKIPTQDYATAQDLNTQIQKLKEQIAALSSGDNAQITTQIENLNEQLRQKEAELARLQSENSSLNERLRALSSSNEEVANLSAQIQRLEEQLANKMSDAVEAIVL